MARYLLTRIVGNDLPPRTGMRQTVRHLEFILEHEPAFPDCDKMWLFNRIVDPVKVRRLKKLVEEAGHKWGAVPVTESGWRQCRNDWQRQRYLTNINGARNAAIALGLNADTEYEYVTPCDGTCFFTQDGWDAFDANARLNPGCPFFVVPTWRLHTYEEALQEHPMPVLRAMYHLSENRYVVGPVEPQLWFGRDADLRFNEALTYGKADKCELLWRLDVPGVWDHWEPQLQQRARQNMSKHAGRARTVGYCCRLPSGNAEADHHNLKRGEARAEGLKKLVADTARDWRWS